MLPGEHSIAFDVSSHISPDGWLGTLLKGTLSFSTTTTWLQLVVYITYLVTVMALFLRPQRPSESVPTARPAAHAQV